MVGVVLYTLIELLNFYFAYKNVFGIRFTKRRLSYVIVVTASCAVQIFVLFLIDNTWRDVIAIVAGLIGAIIVTESKKWKTALLFPIVFFLSSLINILGSYGVAALLEITQEAVGDSIALTLVSESTAILVFIIYNVLVRRREEISLSVGQYVILLIGGVCFFIIISFSQGLLQDEIDFISEMKELTAAACVVIALFFIVLSLWQQIIWKKAYKYRMDNEKYEVFLTGQEEHIRMLIIEDEKRRKLRHDMNAHMLALNAMAEKEEWDMLKEYLGHMQDSLGDVSVNKYTMISAVDAIVDEWYHRAINHQTKWLWEGTIQPTDRITIFEMCTLFSNLLSNAVEAIEKIDKERRIEIKVSNFQEKIVIFIRNTCDDAEMLHVKPKTTKGDEVFHGLGLKNVEEIVKKHEGSIDYEMKDGWFQVDIVL